MRYNRHDYFRYQFEPHLPATFRLQLNNEEKKLSNEGQCEILDISTGGAKFFAFFDLPVRSEKLALQLIFTIHEHVFEIIGNVAWKKADERGFHYGFDFDEGQQVDAIIIDELKHYTRKMKEAE
ncbi:PilZ domain-containing protein [Sporosarcina sp. PTS2304]|uniref:PilZ domain-containing protein n=1 Tax=Sporosarcina sp. PTS2304 TaxID=2283194 RepID=UPI000E0D971C|nr:PilZ domain-containing protein [Sporosarcina sp. PTS2304]AXH98479.1 PilZ domain-containing protein [Sporosarcina sp. PTS2304]